MKNPEMSGALAPDISRIGHGLAEAGSAGGTAIDAVLIESKSGRQAVRGPVLHRRVR